MRPLTGASIPTPAGDVMAPLRPRAPRTPLVATNLEPPPLPRHYRERTRLSERLDAAPHDATRLTLVSAPPGYGKSVVVAGWLASRGTPAAWLTLEPPDNDLVRFVRYLMAALRRVRPTARPATLDLLATGASPAIDQLGATILDEIAALDARFVLALNRRESAHEDLARAPRVPRGRQPTSGCGPMLRPDSYRASRMAA